MGLGMDGVDYARGRLKEQHGPTAVVRMSIRDWNCACSLSG